MEEQTVHERLERDENINDAIATLARQFVQMHTDVECDCPLCQTFRDALTLYAPEIERAFGL